MPACTRPQAVSYVDAGHGLALHIPAVGATRRLPPAGPPFGVWISQRWPFADLELAPGDALVVVSDGVLDTFGTVDEFTEQVDAAIRAHATAEEGCEAVLQLAPADLAEDDVTAVVVRRSAAGPGARQD